MPFNTLAEYLFYEYYMAIMKVMRKFLSRPCKNTLISRQHAQHPWTERTKIKSFVDPRIYTEGLRANMLAKSSNFSPPEMK